MDSGAVRSDIYEDVRGVLGNAGAGQHADQTRSDTVQALLQSARAAFNDACADFSESWNSENAGAIAECLPAEILTMCLRAVPFDALITVTHISRKWRAVALSDRSLWATFRYAGSRRDSSGKHDERMLGQLAAMLDRSRPCPFTLKLPYPARGYERVADRLEALLQSEFRRLRHYDGPFDLYQRVNGHDTPAPDLLTLRLVGDAVSADRPVFRVPSDWGTRLAPNVQRLELEVPSLILPTACAPMFCLTHLQISAEVSPDHRNLFHWCPRLISLDLRDVENTSSLPSGPLPSTLASVLLSSPLGGGTDFGAPLAAWTGYPIRQLTVNGAISLAQPLGTFLSFCPGAVRIDIAHDTVQVFAGTPDGKRVPGSPWRCQVMPSIWHTNQLHALRGACAARLTALSVALDAFAFLMHVQLVAPQLVRFALHMDGPASREARRLPRQLPKADCWLAAPQLRELLLRVPSDTPSVEPAAAPAETVDALRLHLRDLIRFDTPRLKTIVVQGMRDNIAALSCADLTQYADSYREDYSFSWRRGATGAMTP